MKPNTLNYTIEKPTVEELFKSGLEVIAENKDYELSSYCSFGLHSTRYNKDTHKHDPVDPFYRLSLSLKLKGVVAEDDDLD